MWIDRFPSPEAMNTYLDSLARTNEAPAATDCNSGGPGAGTWTGVTGDQQRFVCWAESDGISRLEWASSTGPFAVQVWRHDADIAALAGWYQQVGYRITGGSGPLPTPRGTLNDGENTLVENLPSDLNSLVQSGGCIPWPAGRTTRLHPRRSSARASSRRARPSPRPPVRAPRSRPVKPPPGWCRSASTSGNTATAHWCGGQLGGLYKVSLPDNGCQETQTGEGSTTWHYVKDPNKVVGQLRCFKVSSEPRVLWTYADKSISSRGEAESGTLPGLVRWWTTN